jgi:hypothetical protein
MQSKPKSNSVITHEVVGDPEMSEQNTIIFNVLGAGKTMLETGRLSRQNLYRAAIHGMIQRISDAAAISRDPETGKPATPAEKLAAMSALVEHYHSGTSEWSRVGVGGGPKGGFLFEALVRMYPAKTAEDIRTWLDGQSKSAQAALRANPKVAAIISTIRDERLVGTDVDTEALLAEIAA